MSTTEKKKHKQQVPEAQKILLGLMGERIVAYLLRKDGHAVEESLNPFDDQKDMTVDGQPVEVKTQVPYMIEDSFAVLPYQLKKLKSCHRVYWLSVPLKREDDLAGVIFEMDMSSEELKAHRVCRIDGQEVVCFPRRQPAMKIVGRVNDPALLDQLRKLSTSYL
jgi:hypothetical protein